MLFAVGKSVKYDVYHGYLVPQSPRKLNSAYNSYNKERMKETSDKKPTERFATHAQDWKNLSAEEKSKYNASESDTQDLAKQREEYEKTYLTPIRSQKTTSYSYYTQNRKDSNSKNIQERGKSTGEEYGNLSEEDRQKLEKELNDYKKSFGSSLKKLEEYKIPVFTFDTAKDHYKHNHGLKNKNAGPRDWYTEYSNMNPAQL